MNLKIIFLISSIIGILILIFLTQSLTREYQGEISNITYSSNKVTILLKDDNLELIIFDNTRLNLSSGDIILFTGKKEVYKNKEQIIVDEIYCSSCKSISKE